MQRFVHQMSHLENNDKQIMSTSVCWCHGQKLKRIYEMLIIIVLYDVCFLFHVQAWSFLWAYFDKLATKALAYDLTDHFNYFTYV